MSRNTDIPPYGALGYHWQGRNWFVVLYMWRRGPWRLSWWAFGRIGVIETPILNNVLSRGVVDTLWGMRKER